MCDLFKIYSFLNECTYPSMQKDMRMLCDAD